MNVKEIFDFLAGKNRLLFLIFLSLPFCQPLQIPGLSIPFGILVVIVALQYAFSNRVWLPNRLLDREISSATIRKICSKSLNLLKKMRPFLHSRWRFLFNCRGMRIFNGLLLSLLGVLLALPLPIPFTNIAVGWAILLISLGLLENDGVMVSLGYLATLATLVFFFFLLFSIDLLLNHSR